MADQCNVCRGHLKHQKVTYTQFHKGKLVVVENVPAWVCEQCGERYYDPDVAERLLTVIRSGRAPDRMIEVGVYDLDRVA